MGLLQVNQIKSRLEEFKGVINLDDVDRAPESQKENFFLTRALAAYSIQCLTDEEIQIIAASITDGSDDNGIDAIYYDKDSEELILVQSKWNHAGDSEPELGEIKKFTGGIRDLISLKFSKFNEKIQRRSDEIKTILLAPNTRIKVVLVYTAINLSSHSRTEFNELLDEQNDSNEIASLEIFNQERLHKSLIDSKAMDPIDLEVYLTEWGKKESPKKAYYGQVSALEVVKWWKAHGNKLFTKNLRKLLGDTTINEDLRKTAESEPDSFWYYNNGITMLCDSVKKKAINGNNRDYGVFECSGANIINGAQTVGSIGKFFENDPDIETTLNNMTIQIRLISTKQSDEDEDYTDEKFSDNVTKRNNRQNKIENRDFVALDEQQKRIVKDLLVAGITYHVMRSEDNTTDDTNFDLDESTRALSCAHDIEAAILSHREPGKIWGDINHSRYKQLFNPGVSSYYVWNCVQIQRQIEVAIKEVAHAFQDEDEAILTYGMEFISCIVYRVIGTNKISKVKIGIESFHGDLNLHDIVTKSLEFIKEELPEAEKSIPNIFKNFTVCRELFERIIPKFENLETEDLEEPQSIDFIIETKFANEKMIKRKVSNFEERLSTNLVAEQGFKYWAQYIYDPNRHECGVVSNLHQYLHSHDSDKNQRFILRLSYTNRLIVKFSHSSFGIDYKSLLFGDPDFVAWLSANGNEKERIIIDSDDQIKKLEELNNFIKMITR